MMFCPKCGSILVPKKSGTKVKLACSCGYKTLEKKEKLILKEKILPKEKIEVVDKKIETLPKVDAECPSCRNKKAYYWLVQTRSADEGETTFFRCTRCNHTWRSY